MRHARTDRRDVTRREFLRASTALSAAGLVACGNGDPLDILPPPSFGPALSALRATRDEIDDEPLVVVGGRLPTDLDGHALIVGAVPYGDGTPIFNGDAMVTRLSFTPGEARIKTRLLRTDDFLLDQASASLGPPLAYTSRGLLRWSTQLGVRNFANTALVPVGNGRLIATYDAGRPWEIDPVTLDPITPVGLGSAYLPMVPPITPGFSLSPIHMTTAHPVWDPDDAVLYYVNYGPPLEGVPSTPFTRVMRWGGTHEPTHTDIVDRATGELAPITQACHQLATTERFVVLSDGAFLVEPEQVLGSDATRPQRATTVLWIVPKSELDGASASAVRCEIPVESAHFVAARADAGDRITVVLMHQGSADVSEWVRAGDTELDSGAPVDPRLVGSMVAAADITLQGQYVIDARTGAVLERRILEDERMWGAALWASDPRDDSGVLGAAYFTTVGFDPRTLTTRIVDAYRDQPNRVLAISELPAVALPAQIVHVDQSSMTIAEALALPSGWMPMSPTFVPRRGGSVGEGYLVTPVLGPEWDEIWIFRAGDLAHGPLCRLRHARFDVGFSLHTTWMGELVSSRSTYRVDRASDYAEGLGVISAEAAALVRRVLAI